MILCNFMEKSVDQVEKNISESFKYVKKDILMLNDAFSDIHEKIQHLSMNHATLLGEIEKLKKQIGVKELKKERKAVEGKAVKKKSVKKRVIY